MFSIAKGVGMLATGFGVLLSGVDRPSNPPDNDEISLSTHSFIVPPSFRNPWVACFPAAYTWYALSLGWRVCLCCLPALPLSRKIWFHTPLAVCLIFVVARLFVKGLNLLMIIRKKAPSGKKRPSHSLLE